MEGLYLNGPIGGLDPLQPRQYSEQWLRRVLQILLSFRFSYLAINKLIGGKVGTDPNAYNRHQLLSRQWLTPLTTFSVYSIDTGNVEP